MDRFEHVPTPPQDGSTPDATDLTVITHRQIGNGALWPNASASSEAPDFNGRESNDSD